MSGIRAKWNDGQAVTTPDLQRAADAAHAADDLVYEALMPVVKEDTYGFKRVLPLLTDDEGGSPQQLVAIGALDAMTLYPALIEVASDDPLDTDPNARGVQIAARSLTAVVGAAPTTNSSGVTRTDLLYAVVSRAEYASASRKTKSLTGAISTQTITVEERARITLAIAAGTTTAPADGPNAWNVPLAEITVPHGYVSGAGGLSAGNIKQVWQRAFVAASTARRVFGSPFGSGVPGFLEPVASPEPDWSRFGSERTFVVAFKHRADTATNWNLLYRFSEPEWRNRIVRFSLVRAAVDALEYPPPHAVAIPGASVNESSGWVYTGTSDDTLWTSPRGFVLSIASGVLRISKPAGTAADGVSGDNWLLVIETMDRFV